MNVPDAPLEQFTAGGCDHVPDISFPVIDPVKLYAAPPQPSRAVNSSAPVPVTDPDRAMDPCTGASAGVISVPEMTPSVATGARRKFDGPVESSRLVCVPVPAPV